MTAITYTLRKVDLVEFNEYHAKRNSGYGKSITRHQLIWPAVVGLIAFFIVMSADDVQMGIFMLMGAFMWSVGVPAWLKKKFQQQVLENLSEADVEQAIGDYTLKVTALGLLEKKKDGDELIRWASILKLEKSKHHVYLYLNEDSAVIIPKEMISEDSDFKKFYAEVIVALKKVSDAKT